MHHKGWELWLLKHPGLQRPQDCGRRKEFNFSYFFPLLKVPPSLQPPRRGHSPKGTGSSPLPESGAGIGIGSRG